MRSARIFLFGLVAAAVAAAWYDDHFASAHPASAAEVGGSARVTAAR
jgi:hypothetical protein